MKFNKTHLLIAIILIVLLCTKSEYMMTQDEKMKHFRQASRESANEYLRRKRANEIARFLTASRKSEVDYNIKKLRSPPIYPHSRATVYTPVRLNDGTMVLQAPRDIVSPGTMNTNDYLRMFF